MERPKRIAHDHLSFVGFMHRFYYNNKLSIFICRFYTPLFSILHIAIMLVSCLCGINTMDVLNSFVVVGSVFYITTTLSLRATEKDGVTMDAMIRETFWSSDIANEEINKKLRDYRIRIIISNIYVVSTAISISIFIMYNKICPKWPFVQYDSQIQRTTLAACFTVYTVCAIMSMAINMSTPFYYCSHLEIQMQILGWYFKQINQRKDFGDSVDEQDTVAQHLNNCIKQYIKMVKYGLYCKDVFSRPHLAIEMVTAMVIFALIVYDILKNHNILVVIGFGGFVGFMSVAENFGQVLSDSFIHLYKALQDCEYYNWNATNMKTYLLLLQFAQKEYSIEPCPPFTVDLEGLLWAYKTIYGVATLLQSVPALSYHK